MTRALFLALSRNRTLRRWMEASASARAVTQRFVAGESIDDEIAACERLWRDGYHSTLDYLGENVSTLEDARTSASVYLDVLDRIGSAGLPSTIAIKLSQFGIDFSEEACLENVRRLEVKAQSIGSRVEIDMESSAYTERTIALAIRAGQECGCVRVAVQAYLYRSKDDIARLNEARVPVRLCKGAYREPDEIAYPKKADVDANYVALMKELLERGNYPAIATHDPRILDEALAYIEGRGIAKDRFEFQMLYGIRRDLQKMLIGRGYKLRIYVPYGTEWYPYFMRRLAERPANVWFVLRNMLR